MAFKRVLGGDFLQGTVIAVGRQAPIVVSVRVENRPIVIHVTDYGGDAMLIVAFVHWGTGT